MINETIEYNLALLNNNLYQRHVWLCWCTCAKNPVFLFHQGLSWHARSVQDQQAITWELQLLACATMTCATLMHQDCQKFHRTCSHESRWKMQQVCSLLWHLQTAFYKAEETCFVMMQHNVTVQSVTAASCEFCAMATRMAGTKWGGIAHKGNPKPLNSLESPWSWCWQEIQLNTGLLGVWTNWWQTFKLNTPQQPSSPSLQGWKLTTQILLL